MKVGILYQLHRCATGEFSARRTSSCSSVASFHNCLFSLSEQILSWMVNLRQCNSTSSVNMNASDAAILKTLCSMSAEQWYSLSLLIVRHLNMEKLLYRVRLRLLSSGEINNVVYCG